MSVFSSLTARIHRAHRASFQRWCRVAACVCVIVASGCASYTETLQPTRQALTIGDAEGAIAELNARLDVEDASELPENLNENRALMLLERATLLQAAGHYEQAARDLMHVDDHLEWVDLSGEGAARVMRFIYSDDAGQYRAPAHERLLLNTQNMINFLAAGRLGSARVEARRFYVLARFFVDEGTRELVPGILGLGYYLSGVTYEASGEYESAARFYARAYLSGVWPEAGPERLEDLIALTGYRGRDLQDFGIADDHPLFASVRSGERLSGVEYRARHQQGDVLVVVQSGLSPYRQAERVGMDWALRYSQYSPYSGVYLSSDQRNKALSLHASGVFNTLNFPVLTTAGLPPRRQVRLSVDGRAAQRSARVNVADQVHASWTMVGATAAAAAISRAVVRAVAGEASRQATDAALRQGGTEAAAAGAIGFLAGLAVKGTLSALDTPDTRSWTTLAADIDLFRIKLPAGRHTLAADVGSHADKRVVDVLSDDFILLNFSALR
ncbi:hypothetical protein EA187_06975 [Lujinxingia sediminis]|uniref:Tetratricopeptide repeat protein n=1 Tax=Lujinxingia sediminis TaxID=2480984 RepID=A0ABY0CVP9_9DELT|nr:hypothetical protein [Lujinxingia sediminis]RVU46870.1 hypothetical protein EA187_06975 [Lujinxingia sediminis]